MKIRLYSSISVLWKDKFDEYMKAIKKYKQKIEELGFRTSKIYNSKFKNYKRDKWRQPTPYFEFEINTLEDLLKIRKAIDRDLLFGTSPWDVNEEINNDIVSILVHDDWWD